MFPFEVELRTTINALNLNNALRYVLFVMEDEMRAVVLATIQKVVLTAELINGEPDTIGAAWSNGVVEFRAQELNDFMATCGLVAHELRHVWQYGTGFAKRAATAKLDAQRFQLAVARAECEQDAADFSKSLGFPSPNQQLDTLKDCWAHFSPEQRTAFLRRATEIRFQVRNPNWKDDN